MRYHNSGKDEWAYPRQRRHKDFRWGRIEPLLEDDTIWSCIHTGLGWLVAAVWGVAAVLFLIVWGGS